ncbi:MAG: hypothetical protein ACHQ3P_00350 [Candidatus Limnocylindrales bacterium]
MQRLTGMAPSVFRPIALALLAMLLIEVLLPAALAAAAGTGN